MKAATIAIIGGGNMGRSLAGGLLADGYHAEKIWISSPNPEKLKMLAQQFGVNTTTDNVAAIQTADIIIFCVKPQKLHAVAKELAATIQKSRPLVISVASGIRVATLQQWVGDHIAIVRAMPNTPSLLGCGASGLFANEFTSPEQSNTAESILRAVGIVVWLQEEKMLDVVTGISGSGPAYFFLVMEMLQQAGEKLGLSPEVARLLTLQTALGAARMALESPETLAQLRRHVTSPGGTTEAGIRVMEQADIRTILTNTVLATTQRSEEIARMFATTE